MKNYQAYRKKIYQFSSLCEITIKVVKLNKTSANTKLGHPGQDDTIYSGECDALRRTIYVDTKLSKKTQIAVLLHELGHFYDHFYNPDSMALLSAYQKYLNGQKLSRKEKSLVIECEKLAWKQGESIARLLKIPLGKWFQEEKQISLSYYRSL